MNAHSFDVSHATRREAVSGSRNLRNAIFKLKGIEIQQEKKPAPVRIRLCPACHTPVAPRRHLIAEIQQTVGAFYGFHREHILGDRRVRDVARARQVAMYLATELTGHSIAEVGRRFNRDHTTVLHAVKMVKQRAETDEEEALNITLLRERLGA